jgi:hypothetical protein
MQLSWHPGHANKIPSNINFWEEVSLCCSGWPQTQNPPASNTRELGLQAYIITPGSQWNLFMFILLFLFLSLTFGSNRAQGLMLLTRSTTWRRLQLQWHFSKQRFKLFPSLHCDFEVEASHSSNTAISPIYVLCSTLTSQGFMSLGSAHGHSHPRC